MDKIWCWLFLVPLSIPLMAQDSLLLPEAWAIALENNLSLQQQQKNIQKAQEEILIRRAEYLPKLSPSASYLHLSELKLLELPAFSPEAPGGVIPGTVNVLDFSVNLNQPIFTGLRTRNLLKSARQEHRAQMVEERVLKNRLMLQVGQLYYQIQFNQIQQKAIAASIERINAQLEAVRNFYFAEQASAFDTLEVANRKLQRQSQLQNLKNIYQVLLSNFRFTLNAGRVFHIPYPNKQELELTLPPLESCQAKAVRQRPELQKIELLQEAQAYRAGVLQSAYFPQVYASAAYHYAHIDAGIIQDRWVDFYTINVNLQWDIWNWKQDRRRVQQSRLERQRLEIATRQLEQDVQQQVTEAYQLVDNIRQQIALQSRLVAQEKERYRITREKFSQAQASNLDLTNAEKALIEAELLLSQKYIEWLQMRLQLDFATGDIAL